MCTCACHNMKSENHHARAYILRRQICIYNPTTYLKYIHLSWCITLRTIRDYRFSLSSNTDKDPSYPRAELGSPIALSRPLHFIFYLYYIHLYVNNVYIYIKCHGFETNALRDVPGLLPSQENHPLTTILCQNTKTYTLARSHRYLLYNIMYDPLKRPPHSNNGITAYVYHDGMHAVVIYCV